MSLITLYEKPYYDLTLHSAHTYKSHGQLIRGWTVDIRPLNLEGSFPKRVQGSETQNIVNLRLKYNKNDSTNICLFDSYEGFNVSHLYFN